MVLGTCTGRLLRVVRMGLFGSSSPNPAPPTSPHGAHRRFQLARPRVPGAPRDLLRGPSRCFGLGPLSPNDTQISQLGPPMTTMDPLDKIKYESRQRPHPPRASPVAPAAIGVLHESTYNGTGCRTRRELRPARGAYAPCPNENAHTTHTICSRQQTVCAMKLPVCYHSSRSRRLSVSWAGR